MNRSALDERIATCACHGITLKVHGEPQVVSACNCISCQKRTGSTFGVSAFFRKDQIAAVSGDAKIYDCTSDSGREVTMRFCPNCGTTVYWELDIYPDHVGVAVGCFGDKAFPVPERVVWCDHKHSWVQFPANMKFFDQGPD